MRNLLVHNINTYIHWIANISLQKKMSYLEYDAYSTTEDVIRAFNIVDSLMDQFMLIFEDEHTEVEYEVNNLKTKTSPFKLFTHVITHEFHHKGQILSLSRHMGYEPIDTDIMR